MVGYQGESVRFCIHRQSQSECSKIHVGTPKAPAKCAGMLSIVIIKSSPAIVCAAS